MNKVIATDYHAKRRLRCHCGCGTVIQKGDILMRASVPHGRYYLMKHYFAEPREIVNISLTPDLVLVEKAGDMV